ncbi:MAG TPA: hypothetical protein VJY34_27810 [Roseiarcus sp.]|nr:hypothetical protein [Roseiarcus sp.]
MAAMVNRVFDAAYVRSVFWELEAHVRTSGMTPATLEEVERQAIDCWRAGTPARRAAALIADKIVAAR